MISLRGPIPGLSERLLKRIYCSLGELSCVQDFLSFADIILSGSQALGHIVMSVGTPGTVFFDHVGNLCGQIHIGEDLGSLIAIESCNFKKLIDAFGCTANFFVAFL